MHLGRFRKNPYKTRTLLGKLLRKWRCGRMARELGGLGPDTIGRRIRLEANPAEHFRGKRKTSFFFGRVHAERIIAATPSTDIGSLVSAAEKIAAGRFSFRGSEVNLEGCMDWNLSAGVDPDWRRDLNRLEWANTLLLATHYSGDGRYAKRAAGLLLDWQRRNPPGSPAWCDTFEVAQRINTLSWILHLAAGLPDFSDEALGAVVAALYCSGRWTAATVEYGTANNHLIVEAVRMAQWGILFPEFPGARALMQKGIQLAAREIERQVSPDGVHLEYSIFYHRIVLEALLELIVLARLNVTPLPGIIPERTTRMVEFLAAVEQPGGGFPQFGDGADSDELLRYDLSAAGKMLLRAGGAVAAPDLRTLWLLDGEWPDKDENADGKTASMFGDCYALLARGQGEERSHLLFDCGPFGIAANPGHGHSDCLSFTLAAHGRPMLIDPGTYVYEADVGWRNAFRGTRFHNTVVVDGEDQTPVEEVFGVGRQARCRVRSALFGRTIHLIDAEHDGYKRLQGGVSHRRVLIELGRDGWLVADFLEGSGSHDVEALWHFHPDLDVKLSGNSALAADDGRGLAMEWAATQRIKSVVIRGRERPPQGWVSFEAGRKQPADSLVVRSKMELPGCIITLLHKARGKAADGELEIEWTKSGVAVACKPGSLKSHVYIAARKNGGRTDFFGWRTDADLCVVREGRGGISVLIARGSYLDQNGKSILRLPEETKGMSVDLAK